MAKSLDELIGHLLEEIALTGEQGELQLIAKCALSMVGCRIFHRAGWLLGLHGSTSTSTLCQPKARVQFAP